jgi:regulator of protease activity HflC (stomatin/prohibitin superfamily)
MKKLIIAVAVASTLIGCGRIGTGEVGVRTNFNKTIETTELQPGWFGAVLTSVDHFDIKETEVAFNDMRPKAKDNLSLQDMDISVFYKVNPEMVADLTVKYAGMSAKQDNVYYPAFELISRMGRGAIYDTTAQYDSLTIHNKRNDLETSILNRLQSDLDKNDSGAFTITKVIVRNLTTDPALESAIQQAVRVEKEIQAKKQQIELARAESERLRVEAEGAAKANIIIANSITPQLIELRRIEAMSRFAGAGTHTVILPSDTKSLVNIGK